MSASDARASDAQAPDAPTTPADVADAGASADAVSDVPPPQAVFTAPNQLTLSNATRLAPGEERYQCAVFDWHRDGGIVITTVSPHVGAAIHHADVYWETGPDGPVDPLTGCALSNSWHALYTSGIGTGDLQFPPGTAFPLADDTRLVLQIHYVNASSQFVDTGASVALDLLDATEPFIPIGVLGLGDTRISLPPHAQTTIRGTCSNHGTLENVFLAFPHMHQLGTTIGVTVDEGMPLLDVPRWNTAEQPLVPIGPPQTILAGVPITTTCAYSNTTDHTVVLGGLSTDEMCFVTLYYWPVTDDNGALCDDSDDGGAP